MQFFLVYFYIFSIVYGIVYGPPDWHKVWVDCGHEHQSPINIDTSKVVNKDYPPLKVAFDNPGGLVTGKLENTGHFPTLTIDKSQGTAEITGGPLGDTTYTLNQFHFHFGCENDRGSEHALNGKQFAGQVTALGQFSLRPDGFIVINDFFPFSTHL